MNKELEDVLLVMGELKPPPKALLSTRISADIREQVKQLAKVRKKPLSVMTEALLRMALVRK